ncbi:virion structural protein [Pseudomonas phage Psa21]|uniref:Virion structural protein n=1 Tax=Pseudomonas phage Psa21 TaxID=2530023 RepID=A0A481W4R4_9CAUD|nr:virion structural protein [Pseudomonas phage Psa21]QBJ02628.1 virion structural protein [Pseudomonas phage Psa21]
MSSLLEYVGSLAPFKERKDLLNQLADLEEEYDTTIAPLLSEVRDLILSLEVKSQIGQKYNSTMQRAVNFRGNYLELFFKSMESVRGNLGLIVQEIRRLFAFQFTNSNLTINRANILKYVDALNFYIRWGRKFMLFLVTQESQARGRATSSSWSPAEVDWVQSNLDQFVGLYPAMILNPSELKQKFSQASDAEINAETYDLAVRSLGDSKIDPCRLSGFSPQNNPFLTLGKYVAEWKVARYKASKEEFNALQHRLLELREQLKGQPTSVILQKQIKMYEDRLSEYEYDINATEAKARD